MRVKMLLALCAAVIFSTCAQAQTNRYVWQGSPGPGAPYTSWATAATNINDAIAACDPGDIVWVTNGTYDTGGRVAGGMTNRVVINKAITVIGVNGPDNTFISGKPNTDNSYGPAAIRGVLMTNGATLIGFTVTNGFSHSSGSTLGGGIWCGSPSDIVSNCVIASGRAARGGGVYNGTIYNSTIRNNYGVNWAGGIENGTLYDCLIRHNNSDTCGGALNSVLYNCSIISNGAGYLGGGGAYGSTLYNCLLVGNKGARYGGGALGGTLYGCTLINNTQHGTAAEATGGGGTSGSTVYNSLIVGNHSFTNGAGARGGTIYNCTIVGNATRTTGAQGGGTYASTVYNSIVYGNTATASNNHHSGSFEYSCSLPLPAGNGNIDSDPMFVDPGAGYGTNHVVGNYRLSRGSPCINAGSNSSWMSDLSDPRSRDIEGGLRIDFTGSTVDMGAYEYMPPGSIFILRGQ